MLNLHVYRGDASYLMLKVIFAVLHERNLEDDSVQAVLQKTPSSVLFLKNSFDLLEVTRDILPDLIVLDYDLQERNGIILAHQLHQRKLLSQVPILVLNVPRGQQKKKHDQHQVYLEEPVSPDEMSSSIGRLLQDLFSQ